MSSVAILLGVVLVLATPGKNPVETAHLINGVMQVITLPVILAVQFLWLFMFIYTGRSMVTGSTLSFHVHEEKI